MTSPRQMRSRALPWLALFIGLALTLSGWRALRQEIRRQDDARFDRLKERVLTAITTRFQAASISKTVTSGSSVSVRATGQPAEPAPTMM